jgi:hypothetical protein
MADKKKGLITQVKYEEESLKVFTPIGRYLPFAAFMTCDLGRKPLLTHPSWDLLARSA